MQIVKIIGGVLAAFYAVAQLFQVVFLLPHLGQGSYYMSRFLASIGFFVLAVAICYACFRNPSQKIQ